MPERDDLTTYLCPTCERWHIGHDAKVALARVIKNLGGSAKEQRELFDELTKGKKDD